MRLSRIPASAVTPVTSHLEVTRTPASLTGNNLGRLENSATLASAALMAIDDTFTVTAKADFFLERIFAGTITYPAIECYFTFTIALEAHPIFMGRDIIPETPVVGSCDFLSKSPGPLA